MDVFFLFRSFGYREIIRGTLNHWYDVIVVTNMSNNFCGRFSVKIVTKGK